MVTTPFLFFQKPVCGLTLSQIKLTYFLSRNVMFYQIAFLSLYHKENYKIVVNLKCVTNRSNSGTIFYQYLIHLFYKYFIKPYGWIDFDIT